MRRHQVALRRCAVLIGQCGHRRCSTSFQELRHRVDLSWAVLFSAGSTVVATGWLWQCERHSPVESRHHGAVFMARGCTARCDEGTSGVDARPRTGVASVPAELLNDGLCNSGDELAQQMPADGKLVWYFRHGQSAGNVARIAANEADRLAGGSERTVAYENSLEHVDTPLSQVGQGQARAAQEQIAGWSIKPKLIVASAMTRAIETAAILFERELREGTAKLVVRTELREFFPENNENQGRPLAELCKCQHLQALSCWPQVAEALSEAASREWREHWDGSWAQGPGWKQHCGDLERLRHFQLWLAEQPETAIALVAHFGAINNLVNLEPWAEGREVETYWRGVEPPRSGGLAKRFGLANCSWVALLHVPR